MSDLVCRVTLSAPLTVRVTMSGVGSVYVLPVATAVELGGVKQGTGVTIAVDGTISAAGTYTLPMAAVGTLGGIKVGTRLSIDGSGVLSADVQGSVYTLPVATGSVLGGIKVGTRLTIDVNGVLSADVQTTDISGKANVIHNLVDTTNHPVTGLTGGTLYYYRGYATNSTGTAYSADGSFTTTSSCGGTSYNGYCWRNNTTQSQNCGTFCTGIGKTCVDTTQTCDQDKATFTAVGYTCSSYGYDNAFNYSAPAYNGGSCAPRTDVAWSCGTGAVAATTCSGIRNYWYAICACSS